MESPSRSGAPNPLKRVLDASQPLCRDDLLRALDYIKRKTAEGAPEWSGLDRPQLCAHFACYAEMALLLLHRRTPGASEMACFRAMLGELLPRD